MTHKYAIDLSSQDGQGLPKLRALFARVNVLLGGNGTGKSNTISWLGRQSKLFGRPSADFLSIEGGRAIAVPDGLYLNRGNFDEYGTLELAQGKRFAHRLDKLTNRLEAALFTIYMMGQDLKSRHSDKTMEWQDAGCKGKPPIRRNLPIDHLCETFNQVFPDIRLSFDQQKKHFLCQRFGGKYSASALSDGERQVLAFLADVAELAKPRAVILVDEPELNLDPMLACRLWDEIEDSLPDAVFVYATHCLSFALRQNVDKVFVLRGGQQPAIRLDKEELVRSKHAREFLGAIPAVTSASAALLVEGIESSFDRPFYSWVLGRSGVQVVALQSCASVRAAAGHEGLWKQLGSIPRVVGVIDRDYRSDDNVAELSSSQGLHVLELHEAESYLCEPDVACAIAVAVGAVEPIPARADIVEIIRRFAVAKVLPVAARRASERLRIDVGVSVQNTTLAKVENEHALIDLLVNEARRQEEVIQKRICSDQVKQVVHAEMARCRQAVETSDLDGMLMLVPGKELLALLLPQIGVKCSSNVLNCAIKHLDIEQFDRLNRLRADLRKLLGWQST